MNPNIYPPLIECCDRWGSLIKATLPEEVLNRILKKERDTLAEIEARKPLRNIWTPPEGTERPF